MKFLANQKLATRISIITTAITSIGMLLLWLTVSGSVASMVKNNITNQMTDAVESKLPSSMTMWHLPKNI